MPALPTVTYYKQEEAHLHKHILLSMQHLKLELHLCDILVADFKAVSLKFAELKGKGIQYTLINRHLEPVCIAGYT